MLPIFDLLKGLTVRIKGGSWEVHTGTGEVITGTAANARRRRQPRTGPPSRPPAESRRDGAAPRTKPAGLA
jgi:hypothetical protein